MKVWEREVPSKYRIVALGIIALCMPALSSFLCYMEGQLMDYWLCGYAIDFIYFMVLFFQLEYERKRAKISDNVESTFLRIATGFGLCTAMTAGFYFIPDFYAPFLLFPVLMFALCNEAISVSTSMFFPLIFCVLTDKNVYELSLYILLVMIGLILARALDTEGYRTWGSVFLALTSIFMPIIFEYLSVRKLYPKHGIYSAVGGILVFVLCFFFFRRIRDNTKDEITNRMEDILSDDYSAVIEIRNYSKIEFSHALLVSKICYKYAKRLDLKPDLCAAAGFYYRLGKWKGEPHVENGVIQAKQLSFPPELVLILAEYYGEEKLPSTQESALVHIVDATIKKMQVLKDSAAASTWNRELLVYQTINEFSQSGIYDHSGLTMNQFLTIRDLLVKEELLNELLS